jgi:hypothetical protein
LFYDVDLITTYKQLSQLITSTPYAPMPRIHSQEKYPLSSHFHPQK